MSSIFGRLKNNVTTNSGGATSSPSKKNTPSTPLEQLLVDAGPLRSDGNDKFFGMHNPSNTCYCNSVLQCLYFSEPFRKQVIEFPSRPSLQNGSITVQRAQNNTDSGSNATPGVNTAALSKDAQAEATSPSSPRKTPTTPSMAGGPRPEENKDSFDYQKKQALTNGPLLRMDYANNDVYGMSESLFTGLKDIFEAVIAHKSRTGVITPAKFLEVLRRNYEIFRSPMHQDAHEFLNLLLNEVVEHVEEYSKKVAKDQEARGLAPGLGITVQSKDSKALIPKDQEESAKTASSWVHELFEGTLTSETRCLTCENVSQRDESFLDLSVDLEEHSSVTSCLSKFSEEEMLCERNKFHCDQCCGLQEAEKRMKIKRLPHVLALHLKRFKYVEELGRMQKLFHRVVFPFHLRLLNTTDDAEDPDRLYELYAIIVHLGSTPFHGHYVSIIKTKDKGWLLFDDELVLPVDKDYVRNFFGGDPRNPACAYVLFYQETTEEALHREHQLDDPGATIKTDGGLSLNADDAEPFSPATNPSPLHSPAREEPAPYSSLSPVSSAPPIPNEPASQPYIPPRPVAVDQTIEDGHVLQDADPSDLSPAQPGITRGPSAKHHHGGAFGRFRNSSLSLRAKPKFWSQKDKEQHMQHAASEADSSAVQDAEPLLLDPASSPQVDGGTAAQTQAQTQGQGQGQGQSKQRLSRFGLGKKKSTQLV